MINAEVETEAAIRVESLTRRFGRTTALDSLSLTVPQGAVFLLAGENGAGKTTLLRVLLGLLRADEGSAVIAGIESGPDGAVRARIGYVPETFELPYGRLRIRDLLAYDARYRHSWDDAYAAHLADRLDIDVERRLSTLSKGSLRRVQLVEALAYRPPVLLLDEPLDGLDPLVRDTVLRLLVEHVSDAPTTLLIATHVVHEMERLADHVGVLRSGRLVAAVAHDDLRAQLRRYRFNVAADWHPPELCVMRRTGDGGEREWIIRGVEPDIAARLSASGAALVSSAPLTLAEAVVALLSMEEG
jgi:ABC-2 type transport system ATP-binding protein